MIDPGDLGALLECGRDGLAPFALLVALYLLAIADDLVRWVTRER